ncbi:hypothetical protein Asal01_01187 [Fodinibius salicampi]
MDIGQKTTYISLFVLAICILLTLVIYLYTGHLVIVLLIAPPIIHWILKKRKES